MLSIKRKDWNMGAFSYFQRLGQRTDKGSLVFFTLIFLLRIKTAVKIRLLALTNAGAEDYNKTVH